MQKVLIGFLIKPRVLLGIKKSRLIPDPKMGEQIKLFESVP
jgi:hypothetical protein